MKKILAVGFFAMMLSGCWTVSETTYPTYPMTALPETVENATVTVRGFDATFVDTIPVDSYQTIYVPGHCGRRHYHPGHYETYSTTTYVQQTRESKQFFEQAMERMEEAGFNIKANPADYIVEAKFSGPFEGPQDPGGGTRALLFFASLMTYDQDADVWKAKVKIYDNHTGKLVFSRDYSEEYSASCFSIIPLFGPAFYPRTEKNYMEAWCLSALTDRITSEASAFLQARAAGGK